MKLKSPLLLATLLAAHNGLSAAPLTGWFNWRGPNQNGTSAAKNLPATLDPAHPLWTADFPGMSTAVGFNGKIYIMGYLGEGPDLTEGVACFDAATGKKLWQKMYGDYLSDTIYLRYATSSPTLDPLTGNVYIQDTQGIFAGFNADGGQLWEHSLMEEYGRLTFPNGRTASPAVDDNLVITRGITANWGANGPAADRFYAFDKTSGQLVWTSTPGGRPKDNSYSHPVFAWRNGKRVFFSATGDGSVVCVNARTGDPIFRVELFKAGINSSVLVYHNDTVIAIYGTPYEPGQMVALKIPDVTPTGPDPVIVPRASVELWHNEIRTSASSPILVGDRVYVTSEVGNLVSVDATDGNILWKMQLGTEQRNSSPLYADGRIYAPILNDPATSANAQTESETGGRGALYVIDPSDSGGKILNKIVVDGRCYGTPTPYQGRIYLQTNKKLYCFGAPEPATANVDTWEANPAPAPGKAARLMVVPSELLLQPGQTASFHVSEVDANGLTVKEITDAASVKWASYVPPTAKVKAAMKASFTESGQLIAAADHVPSAGAFEATADGLKGYIRGRILPGVPLRENFDEFNLTETTTNLLEPPTPFAYPPLPWIGARFKFEVRDHDTNKCLVKTIDNPFFQRATVFMGTPDLHNYTIEADVMSEGNKRKMSEVGVINQRYLIELKGNEQVLQIASNQELLRQAAPFKWSPNTWYHLKARVDVAADGSGVIRGKAWKAGEAEPPGWVNELAVHHVETSGCPGLFSFSSQGQRVFVDNISVTSN